jgi:hypothetical protein
MSKLYAYFTTFLKMLDITIKNYQRYKIHNRGLLDNYHPIICMIEEEEEMIQSTNDTPFSPIGSHQ